MIIRVKRQEGVDYAAEFAAFDERVGAHKTGVFGHYVEMYTKRSGDRERVFCVKWYERNGKFPTAEAWERECRIRRRGNGFYTPGNEWVEKRRLFPYTAEGLQAAVEFVDSDEYEALTAEWNGRSL